jgi:hypothetical protein
MKNLKKISTLLLFSIAFLSCSNNEELLEVENLKVKEVNLQQRVVGGGDVSLIHVNFVKATAEVTKQSARDYFGDALGGLLDYQVCGSNKNVEVWEVTYLTPRQFNPTEISADGSDDPDKPGFQLYIDIDYNVPFDWCN